MKFHYKIYKKTSFVIQKIHSYKPVQAKVMTTKCSRPEVFRKKAIMKNLAKSTGKQLCRSLFFNKITSLRFATFLKKKLRQKCFFVNFAKLLIFYRIPLVAASVDRRTSLYSKIRIFLTFALLAQARSKWKFAKTRSWLNSENKKTVFRIIFLIII